MSECTACEGSGRASNGDLCGPCKGSGDLPMAYHLSESVEHYTPSEYVEAARQTLGGIDLDPASCRLAQAKVQALAWYGPDSEYGNDGLALPWIGRVLLNPPGGLRDDTGRPVYRARGNRSGCNDTGQCGLPPGHKHTGVVSSASLWWAFLVSYWARGEVDSAIFVGFSLELLRSTQSLASVPEQYQPLAFPLCVPKSRMAFDTERDGVRVPSSSPPNGNVIVLLPTRGNGAADMIGRFVEAHKGFGACRV